MATTLCGTITLIPNERLTFGISDDTIMKVFSRNGIFPLVRRLNKTRDRSYGSKFKIGGANRNDGLVSRIGGVAAFDPGALARIKRCSLVFDPF